MFLIFRGDSCKSIMLMEGFRTKMGLYFCGKDNNLESLDSVTKIKTLKKNKICLKYLFCL